MTIHEIVSGAEAAAAESVIAETMSGYGLDPNNALDCFTFARLMELNIVPIPGEASSLH